MSKMAPWNAEQIIQATGASLTAGPGDARFAGVGIDSRNIAEDELFVAIAGENHDGHDFLPQVVQSGVGGVVVSKKEKIRDLDLSKTACFLVKDTIAALGDLAGFNRDRMAARVAGLTGSNGKTSTKELLYSILKQEFSTLKNPGNLNNHIGMPLTLLSLLPSHQWAICEMGMNHPGEIRYLAQIAKPEIGLITNVGPGHLEGLGSVDNVALAKKELLDAMDALDGGTAVLNADDHRVAAMADDFSGLVVWFGSSSTADVRVENRRETATGQTFDLWLSGAPVSVELASHGSFMAQNAAAAAAVGLVAGVSPEQIARGLASFRSISGRMSVLPAANGGGVIDDTYNANPASMVAAMDTLMGIRGNAGAVLVLGDMLELGPRSPEMHRDLGRAAAEKGADHLFSLGGFSGEVVKGAREAGMDPSRVHAVDREAAAQAVLEIVKPGDWVLVKGSRGMKMETISQALVKALGVDPAQAGS